MSYFKKHWPAYEISNKFDVEIPELKPKTSKFIHYTSLDAFYSIFDTGKVRFTSIRSTNDPSEFINGRRLLENTLIEIRKNYKTYEKAFDNWSLNNSLDNYQGFIFCTSMATDDDEDVGDLNQWRLYGSNGLGIAFVINSEIITPLGNLNSYMAVPRKVIYDKEEAMALITSQVSDFFEDFESLPLETIDWLREDDLNFQAYLSNRLYWLPAVFKHKAYKNEKEVRFIRHDIGESAGNKVFFPENNTIRKPTIEISIAERRGEIPNERMYCPIESIIIGPSADQDAVEDSIRQFLKMKNYILETQIKIKRSDIPYRAIL